MRRIARFTVLAVALGGLAVAAPAASATADTTVALPMSSFQDIAVDAVHGHVFLTGGDATGVVARNLDGSAATTLTNEAGAFGLALSDDSSTLYVGLGTTDAVAAIDTATLTETARYATGASTCPALVAVTGTSVWFGYGCGATWQGGVGVVDLSGDTPAVTLARQGTAQFYVSPFVAAAGDHLVVGERGSAPSTLYSYPVTGATLGTPATTSISGDMDDMAVTPDHADVILAEGSPYYHPRYKVSDLSADGQYGTNNPYPNSVATAGEFVAAGLYAAGTTDVTIYRSDGISVRAYDFADQLETRGLAFTPDGATLYAVGGAYSSSRTLHVLHDPTKYASTLALTKPSSAHINVAYTITGTLSSTTTIPAGAVIHVTRKSPYDTVALPNVTTGSNGAFSVTNKVSRRGVYTYTFTFDGDATHAGVTKPLGVQVIGLTPSITVTANAATYNYHATATVTAHLGTTHTNRTLRISATPYLLGATVLKTGAVNSSGNLTASSVVTRRTAFSAYFAGDDTYEPRTVVRTVLVKAALSETLLGYYATSGSYRLYHTSVDPTLRVGVTPNRYGTCVAFTAQRYVSGAWQPAATQACFRLDSTSHVEAFLYGTHPVGIPYRMQATFAGDTSNVKTVGGWVYFKFTS